MSHAIRVVIAEDSPTIRQYLITLIEETPDMRVVGEASDGSEVIRLVQQHRPDVVSMDVKMPGLDGLEATRRIMAHAPTPIVIVSSLLDVDVDLSLDAITAGALAVVGKPPDRLHPTFAAHHRQLITTLRAMAGVRVISRRHYRDLSAEARVPQRILPSGWRFQPEVIVIGASTGGPSALLTLLGSLPVDFPVPILIGQHMPQEFIPGLVRWLNAAGSLRVSIAENNGLLAAGQVFVAPASGHLTIVRDGSDLRMRLLDHTPLARYQPSIDILMDSVARVCGAAAVGVILTGMGNDGALGLLAMQKAGALTIAQDEKSSTVFGMPNAAVQVGAVQVVMPLANIATKIMKLL